MSDESVTTEGLHVFGSAATSNYNCWRYMRASSGV